MFAIKLDQIFVMYIAQMKGIVFHRERLYHHGLFHVMLTMVLVTGEAVTVSTATLTQASAASI